MPTLEDYQNNPNTTVIAVGRDNLIAVAHRPDMPDFMGDVTKKALDGLLKTRLVAKAEIVRIYDDRPPAADLEKQKLLAELPSVSEYPTTTPDIVNRFTMAAIISSVATIDAMDALTTTDDKLIQSYNKAKAVRAILYGDKLAEEMGL